MQTYLEAHVQSRAPGQLTFQSELSVRQDNIQPKTFPSQLVTWQQDGPRKGKEEKKD